MAVPHSSGSPLDWQPQRAAGADHPPEPAGPVAQTERPGRPERPEPPRSAVRRSINALFEIGLDGLIAPRLVRFLHVVLVIMLTIGALVQIVGALGVIAGGDGKALVGLLWLLLAPAFWFLGLAIYRGLVELMLNVFRKGDGRTAG